jgi:transcriptional regulator with PAS, ATPase and Fis domain
MPGRRSAKHRHLSAHVHSGTQSSPPSYVGNIGPGVFPAMGTEGLHLLSVAPAYQAALGRLRRYARHDDVIVLLEGESGTGKSLFARQLHSWSPRAAGAYSQINLAGLDDGLASSELFGHVAGAFTGAQRSRRGLFMAAQGGSLFLDEIGQTSLSVQRKLLHVVESRTLWPVGADRPVPADVRLIAATNKPLGELVEQERFLHDLLPRIASFSVRIPPLRERPDDVLPLVDAMLQRDARRFGYEVAPRLSASLRSALRDSNWVYNVRQLEATVRRLLIEGDGEEQLTLAHLSDDAVPADRADGAHGGGIEDMLHAGLSKRQIGAALGLSRATVYRRIAALTPACDVRAVDTAG